MQKLSLLAVVVALSGCLFVVSVTQPSSGVLNQPFSVTVVVEVEQLCETADCIPLFTIALPTDWVIDSCSYSGDISGTCLLDNSSDYREEIDYPASDSASDWRVYAGSTQAFSLGERMVVTWTIVPTTAGPFSLDYGAGAAGPVSVTDEDGVTVIVNAADLNQDSALFDFPINIRGLSGSEPRSVPGLGPFALLLLMLGMLFLTAKSRVRLPKP